MRYIENDKIILSHSLEYLDYVRTLNCCVTGSSMSEPHHLEAIGMGANRKKPNMKHFTSVPVCREIHTELHAKGIHYMQEKYRIQFWQEAFYILAKWLITKKEIIS